MTDRLENILISEIEENGKEGVKDRALFSRIYMPQDVYQKMLKYARFANPRSGECYGYLIGSSNRVNRLIEDVYFAPNQTNNSAHTQISGKTVLKVGKEMREKGKRVLGWWHSHADIEISPSGTDDENFHTMLDQIAPTNYVIAYEDIKFLKEDIKKTLDGDNRLIICDRNNSARRLEMLFSEIRENPLIGIPLKGIVVRLPKQISYAYSIITNARGEKPYAGLLTREFCMSCKSDAGEEEPKELPLRVLKNYNIGVKLDDAELKKEVNSKIIRRRISVVVPVYEFREGTHCYKGGNVSYYGSPPSLLNSAIRGIKGILTGNKEESKEKSLRDAANKAGKEEKKDEGINDSIKPTDKKHEGGPEDRK